MRYGYHLVIDGLKANQGSKSHKDVEATTIHHFQHLHEHHGDQGQALPGRQASRQLLSGDNTIDNPAARNCLLDVTSASAMGVPNQEFINRAARCHQPGPEEHDPRNDVLAGANRAGERKHAKCDVVCAAPGQSRRLFALAATGGHGASISRVGVLAPDLTKQTRDSALIPSNTLVAKSSTRTCRARLGRGTTSEASARPSTATPACQLVLALLSARSRRRAGLLGPRARRAAAQSARCARAGRARAPAGGWWMK